MISTRLRYVFNLQSVLKVSAKPRCATGWTMPSEMPRGASFISSSGMARTTPGMPTRMKVQRQSNDWASTPPSARPSPIPAAWADDNMAIAPPRLLGSYISEIME